MLHDFYGIALSMTIYSTDIYEIDERLASLPLQKNYYTDVYQKLVFALSLAQGNDQCKFGQKKCQFFKSENGTCEVLWYKSNTIKFRRLSLENGI